MSNIMYWLDIDGDRTGLEVLVNDFPAERLLRTHGIQFPVNEYLRSGVNQIVVRRGPWASNGADGDPGTLGVKLIRRSVQGATVLSEEEVFNQAMDFQAAPPMTTLFTGSFGHDGPGALDLAGWRALSPADLPVVAEAFSGVAAMWRAGNGEALVRWMSSYVRDYVRAYPLETDASMNARIRRMAEHFRGGRVEFDPGNLQIQPLAGGFFADCLSPAGAAVRVILPTGLVYDMWSVVGVRDGLVTLIR